MERRLKTLLMFGHPPDDRCVYTQGSKKVSETAIKSPFFAQIYTHTSNLKLYFQNFIFRLNDLSVISIM